MLPSSIAEVTPEWLTDVLRSAGALATARIVRIEATTLNDSAGLMSRVVRLSLAYDAHEAAAPTSLIAKFPPASADSHDTGLNLGFFEGECGFYREMAQNSAVRAPRCYFSEFDPLTGRFLTLLEDLSSARLGDVGAGCTRHEATRAIEMLAGLHASWWDGARLGEHAWLRSRTDRLAAFIPMIPEAWPMFTSRFGAALDREQMDVLGQAHGLLRRSCESLVRHPVTLVHGDFKLDNLFFQSSGEIVVADWGLVMAGPPMFDVATFLGINFSAAQRRAHEAELVDTYVAVLADHGVEGYAFDQAYHDYKLQLFGLLPQLICAGGLANFPGTWALDGYASGVRRVVGAVIEHRVVDYLA